MSSVDLTTQFTITRGLLSDPQHLNQGRAALPWSMHFVCAERETTWKRYARPEGDSEVPPRAGTASLLDSSGRTSDRAVRRHLLPPAAGGAKCLRPRYGESSRHRRVGTSAKTTRALARGVRTTSW
jgi:hypothetical protein